MVEVFSAPTVMDSLSILGPASRAIWPSKGRARANRLDRSHRVQSCRITARPINSIIQRHGHSPSTQAIALNMASGIESTQTKSYPDVSRRSKLVAINGTMSSNDPTPLSEFFRKSWTINQSFSSKGTAISSHSAVPFTKNFSMLISL